jgi:hypothetical protein
VDAVEGLADVLGTRSAVVMVWSGLDLDVAIAAGSVGELPDRLTCPAFDPAVDGQGGEHDRAVSSI